MKRARAFLWLFGLLAACEAPVDAGGAPRSGADGDDPLAVADDAPPGSLDALHASILLPSCAGQPGLCHHGQFEPNLSTPALAYEDLVLRPGLEHDRELRVAPGDPGHSLLVDKLRDHDVLSQMPLGADPLPEADIEAIERWIEGGALRRPGADPAPVLNNPPAPPEIGIFDAAGARLDSNGAVVAPAGTALTLRQSVRDFETDDAEMPFVVFVMSTADGSQVLFDPSLGDGAELAVCAYDGESPPAGIGDVLNWQFAFAVPETLDVQDPVTGARSQVPASGEALSIIAAYLDDARPGQGILTYSVSASPIEVP